MANPDTGNGTTLACGTSGFNARLTNIEEVEQAIEALESSDLSTTNQKEWTPSDLYDFPEFGLEFFFNTGTVTYPSVGVSENITITYPGGKVLAGTGFFTSRVFPQAVNGQLLKGKAKIKFDGLTEVAYT